MDFDEKLEQRVKALEYEIKILKNEIQRTLLDIQEQILVHYYPDLRSETEGLEEGVVQSYEAVKRKQTDAVRTSPAEALARAQATTSAPTETAEPGPEPTVKVTPVSLDQVRAGQAGESARAAQTNQAQVSALSGWVTRMVLKIGPQRTGDLLEAAVAKQWLAFDVVDTLHKVVAFVNVDDVPATVAVNDVLKFVIELSNLLERGGNPDDAISLIDEAHLG